MEMKQTELKDNQWYGWYSLEADLKSGHAKYNTVDGKIVKVTNATRSKGNPYSEPYKGDEYVGVLTECISHQNVFHIPNYCTSVQKYREKLVKLKEQK